MISFVCKITLQQASRYAPFNVCFSNQLRSLVLLSTRHLASRNNFLADKRSDRIGRQTISSCLGTQVNQHNLLNIFSINLPDTNVLLKIFATNISLLFICEV